MEMPICPLFQTTRPGVFRIVPIEPVFLHRLNIPLAERSGQLFAPYLLAVVPLDDQKNALISPTQSAAMRFSAMCFMYPAVREEP